MDDTSQKNPKSKGGRKPKPLTEKAIYKIGGFWLTKAEKEIYDKNFKASGLENHTEFFRRIMFKKPIRMYYQDIHTEKIFIELLKIESEIQRINSNHDKVSRHILSISSENNLHFLLKNLRVLTQNMTDTFQHMIPLLQPFEARIQLLSPRFSNEDQHDKEGEIK